MALLVSAAGKSRSGKGTLARIFTEEAQKLGFSVKERQLSGPGKQYLASAWNPSITESPRHEYPDRRASRPQRVQPPRRRWLGPTARYRGGRGRVRSTSRD